MPTDLEIINRSLQAAAARAAFDETKVKRTGGQFSKQAGGTGGGTKPRADARGAGAPGSSKQRQTNSDKRKQIDINKWNAAVMEIMKRDGIPAAEAAANLVNLLKSDAAAKGKADTAARSKAAGGGKPMPREGAEKLEEDDPKIPTKSRSGAKIKDFTSDGVMIYEDGSVYDSKGWQPAKKKARKSSKKAPV